MFKGSHKLWGSRLPSWALLPIVLVFLWAAAVAIGHAQGRPAVEIGRQSSPGSAAADAQLGLGYRYQYLSGGAGRGTWPTWNVDGNFPLYYIQDSKEQGVTPVFSYYMICQATDACYSNESSAFGDHLASRSIMISYWEELALFFEKAAEEPNTEVILHVEPDMWGFLQRDSPSDHASNYPNSVQVSATGVAGLAGLPNSLSGLAQGYFALRDYHGASNVKIAYHLSDWGTNVDLGVSNPSPSEIVALADRSAAFYLSLDQPFDLTFVDIRDRDAGWYAYYGDSSYWWDAQDYQNHIAYLDRFREQTGQAFVLWQLPYGNTLYRTLNNTPYHFQDNVVETLFEDPNYSTLAAYEAAGLIAVLFGQGDGITTCPCDAANDGVTNPSAINGNGRSSLSADDDGGYFIDRVQAYYQSSPPATPTPQLLRATLAVNYELDGLESVAPGTFSLTATVYDAEGGTPIAQKSAAIDQPGYLLFEDLLLDEYLVSLSHGHGLTVVDQVTLAAGGSTLEIGPILLGDMNGDNAITIVDFSILSSSFNLSSGEGSFDDRADLNRDGVVTAIDFSILAKNFNKVGEELPT
ncbi:MAG: dockerin type I domain-containing protein [Chloroflexota bacterium]